MQTVGRSFWLEVLPAGLTAHRWGMSDTRDQASMDWDVNAPNRPPYLTSKAARALLVLMDSARRRRERKSAARSEAA